jgi:hypothetical protein
MVTAWQAYLVLKDDAASIIAICYVPSCREQAFSQQHAKTPSLHLQIR